MVGLGPAEGAAAGASLALACGLGKSSWLWGVNGTCLGRVVGRVSAPRGATGNCFSLPVLRAAPETLGPLCFRSDGSFGSPRR